MAQAQPVVEEMPESQQQDSEEKQRELSTIAFPYQSLNDGIEIARAVHDLHGSAATHEQIAAHTSSTPTSSTYRTKVSTAKVFGLISTSQGMVMLTPLGSRICDPQQEKAARAEAFLAVPLYNAVFERFKGGTLPPSSGLESALGSLGVTQKQRDRARQILQRSAQEAGFFQYGKDRLVLPAIKASAAPFPTIDPAESPEEPKTKKKSKDGDDADRRHPLIEGLLKELPEPQTEWTTEDRKNWLEMASTIFNVIYRNSDDSRGSLRVVVEKASAKQLKTLQQNGCFEEKQVMQLKIIKTSPLYPAYRAEGGNEKPQVS